MATSGGVGYSPVTLYRDPAAFTVFSHAAAISYGYAHNGGNDGLAGGIANSYAAAVACPHGDHFTNAHFGICLPLVC
ncbi:MAG: hypothetical protein Fur0021_14510 [Candidatus Promineifilaceae bacterium]